MNGLRNFYLEKMYCHIKSFFGKEHIVYLTIFVSFDRLRTQRALTLVLQGKRRPADGCPKRQ